MGAKRSQERRIVTRASAKMRFSGSLSPHDRLFLEIEALCSSIDALSGEIFEIEIYPDFDGLPQARGSKTFLETPAGYIPTRRIIVVNRKTFDPAPTRFQCGVILHE